MVRDPALVKHFPRWWPSWSSLVRRVAWGGHNWADLESTYLLATDAWRSSQMANTRIAGGFYLLFVPKICDRTDSKRICGSATMLHCRQATKWSGRTSTAPSSSTPLIWVQS